MQHSIGFEIGDVLLPKDGSSDWLWLVTAKPSPEHLALIPIDCSADRGPADLLIGPIDRLRCDWRIEVPCASVDGWGRVEQLDPGIPPVADRLGRRSPRHALVREPDWSASLRAGIERLFGAEPNRIEGTGHGAPLACAEAALPTVRSATRSMRVAPRPGMG